MLGVGCPLIGGHGVTADALLLTLILDLAHRWRESRQLYFADQNLLLTGCRVHIPQLPMLTGIIALYKGSLGIVRRPFDRFRTSSGDAAFGENIFDCQCFCL